MSFGPFGNSSPKDNPEAATRLVDAVGATFKALALRPGLGRPRTFRNRHLTGIRSRRVAGFDSYVIFYREIPDGIQVLHVYHGARNIEALFEKK